MYIVTELMGGERHPPDAVPLLDEVHFWSQELTHTNIGAREVEYVVAALSDERVVVAGLAAHFVIDTPNRLFVDTLFTCPRHQSQGIGAALVGQVLEAERFRAAEQIRLIPMIGSLEFYQGLGFEPESPDDPYGPNIAAPSVAMGFIADRHKRGRLATTQRDPLTIY